MSVFKHLPVVRNSFLPPSSGSNDPRRLVVMLNSPCRFEILKVSIKCSLSQNLLEADYNKRNICEVFPKNSNFQQKTTTIFLRQGPRENFV